MLPLLFVLLTTQSPSPSRELTSLARFRCDFPDTIERAYTESAENPTTGHPDPVTDLVFDTIDYRAGKALVRKAGSADAVSVTVITGERVVSFLATNVDRNPMLMTIFVTPRPHDRNARSNSPTGLMRSSEATGLKSFGHRCARHRPTGLPSGLCARPVLSVSTDSSF